MAEEAKNWQDKGGSAKGTSFEINTEIEKMGSKVADAVNAAGEAGEHKSTEISRLLADANARDAKAQGKKDVEEMEARANEERNNQLLEGLTGFAKAGMKMRLTAAKLKKVAAAKIKDWGAAKIATVKKAAGSLLDFLQKGLGLGILWALFWFIKNQPWKMISEEVKENIGIIVDAFMGIGAWIGIAKLKAWLKSAEGGGKLAEKFAKVSKWFKDSWIGRLIERIKAFFDPKQSKHAAKFAERIKKIKDWFTNSWMGQLINKIKAFFDPKQSKHAAKFAERVKKVKDWFTNSWISNLINKIKHFFTAKGGGGGALTKIQGWFKSVTDLFGKSKIITKFAGWVKTAGKVLGKIFLPFTVLMSLWEAVTGFMTGFEETEGSMFDKIMGGIGGAIKSLLDFFIFGIADMVQLVIVWLLELFGFDGAAVAVGDFNLVGKIKDIVFGIIDWFMLIFQDPVAALGQLWSAITGGMGGLMDMIWWPFKKAIAWVLGMFGWDDASEAVSDFVLSEFIAEMWGKVVDWVKGLFAWGMAAGETEDGGWSLMKFVNEVWAKVKGWVTGLLSWASDEDEGDSIIIKYVKKAINGVKAWFGKMFDFGSAEGILKSVINVLTWFPNMIKDAIAAVTTWLLGLFGFDDAAKKVADANKFSIGDLVMNAIKGIVEWLEKLFDIDIGMILSNVMGALGDAGKKVLGWLGFGDDDGKKKKAGAMGGPVGAGEPILVGEHGPELFVPSASGKILPKMQTENAMGGAGGAPTIINAPTTSNVSNGSTTMAMASSSINPMNEKYFRN